MENYVCDDRLDEEKICADMDNMTEDEVEQFLSDIEKNGYPTKYLL